MTTPYDQRILWMHWMGDKVGENDIRQLIATVKKYSPNVDGVAIKTSDGPLWQGAYDTKKLMAITGMNAIQTWVAELQARKLGAYLWASVRGRNATAESNLIIQACRVPNVQAMILDLDVRDWYEAGLNANHVRSEIKRIRAGVGANFTLGVSFDPRGEYPNQVYLDEWAAQVDILHPRIFHWDYSEGQRQPEEYIDEAFTALSKYGKPIVPILQAHKDTATLARVPENDVYDAGAYSFEKGAPGVIYFRLGAAGPLEFRGVSRVEEGKTVTSVAPQPAVTQPKPTATTPTTVNTPPPVSEPSRPPAPVVTVSQTTTRYVVVTESLNLRTGPGLEARLRVQGQRLNMGDKVDILDASMQDDEGYTWGQIKDGYWFALKTSNGSEVYAKTEAEVAAAKPEPQPTVAQPVVRTTQPPADDGKKTFLVVTDALRVRSAPNTSGANVEPKLARGQQVEVDPNSRTEANGLVWWKHATGWSAEKTLGGSEVFLMDYKPSETGNVETPWKFEVLPVSMSDLGWFYYFGNTIYAFNNGKRWNYDGYSQGLHGGLDFGHRGGANVYAGVHGVFDGPGRAFGPNRVDVIVGDYRIIYGHLGKPANYPKGTPITPDMKVGEVESSLQHLHLEIRYQGRLIVNGMNFLKDDDRAAIIAKHPPVGQFGFYSSPRWQQWLTPLDQPTIVVGGPIIGPRGA